MNIEEINKVTGDILAEKEACESLEYKISKLEKDDSVVRAELTLEINNNKRSQSRYWLAKSEVISILQRELSYHLQQLEELKKKFPA